MKKRQKIWIVVLLTLLAAAAVFFALHGSGGKDDAPQKGNLIVNGDFALTTDGEPDGWQTGAWVTSAGASYLEAVTLEDGTTAALVENAAANDARFEQTIAVRENATYRLTARVMAEGCGEGTKGANVSFSGVYGTSRDLHDTNGQWETADPVWPNRQRAEGNPGHGAAGRLRRGEHRQGVVHGREP